MSKFPIFFLFLFLYSNAYSQTNSAPITLDSPNNAMYVHLFYLQNDSYQPDLAAQALAQSGLAQKEIEKRSIQLKQILDGKGLFVYFQQISTNENYIDSLTKQSIYLPFPKELPNVFLKKDTGKWQYSTETVNAIPTLHKKVFPYGTDILLNYLPLMGQTKVLGLAIWQYLGLIMILIFGIIAHVILSRILRFIFNRIKRRPYFAEKWNEFSFEKIARYVSVLIIIRMIRVLLPVLLLPVNSMEYAISIIRITTVILIIMIALRIVDIIMNFTYKFTQTTVSKMDEQLVPILRRFLQVFIILGGILQLLSIFNVNLTALIAGVSIGGLALALAAKDTVQNLIGSVMIFIDRPFQIGDYISDGTNSGTIEEVGFRSTRLRKSDSSLVAIPNGTLANKSITNMGVRIYRLFQTQFGLTYQTSPEKIENFIAKLKELAENNSAVRQEGVYVALVGLDASALSVLFRVQLAVEDYAQELIAKEKLLLDVIRIAADMGIDFAYPTTTVFVEK